MELGISLSVFLTGTKDSQPSHASTMIPTLVRRAGSSVPKAIPAFLASFPARKTWPPDFKKLTPQEQLRFEKKYKRRVGLASRNPRWDKAVKFAQFFSIMGLWLSSLMGAQLILAAALIYMFFFSEFEFWGEQYKPSKEVSKI